MSDKTLKLEKELIAYNFDEAKVKAPQISYTYTVKPATVAAGTTVTDNADKHKSGEAMTVPVKAGKTGVSTGMIVAWNNEEINADPAGASNKKAITISFANVVFDGPGVYRYEIEEKLTGADDTYAKSGVTETDGTHKRYIDVYVRPAATGYTDGATAAQWDIYGFTCFYNNDSITDADKTTKAVKTTGFVAGTTNGTTPVTADSYYTYNLVITKTVVGDEYAKNTHEFPFSLIFKNQDVTKNILLDTTVSSATDFTHNAGAPTWHGVATVKSGGSIKYIGIPCGTDVEVYETNDVNGVTYKVATFINGASTDDESNAVSVDAAVTWGSKPSDGLTQTTRQAYQSTAYTVDTTKDTEVKTANFYKIEIVNTLLTISPTGVVLRVAPYVLILGAGLMLLLISRKRKAAIEEE